MKIYEDYRIPILYVYLHPYEIKAESLLRTKLTTGSGITSIDRTIYVPVYYSKDITLTEDRTIIAGGGE
jgi:hypothetical protein